jgi:hypothetical protein
MTKYLMIISIILFYSLAISGCSSSGGGAPYTPRDRTAPEIQDFTLAPPAGTWRGGTGQVNVVAADNVGVTSVIARISGPGAVEDAIPLAPVAGLAGRYRGDVPVPANTNSNSAANTYYVTVWAQDAEGNSGSAQESLSVVVPPPDAPLPPPVW